MRLHTVVCE